jgi:hypothetical protein
LELGLKLKAISGGFAARVYDIARLYNLFVEDVKLNCFQ